MSGVWKRILDLSLASTSIVVLSPVFAILACIALASSGTPILFCQVRVGRYRRPFTLLKFRTMRPATEAHSGGFTPGDRSRVTGLGRFLRRSKLDELPQLWNVLRGDMSLVGPRPEVPKWTEAYPDRWDKVLTVRPGITDPTSIAFRDEESLLAAAPDPERLYREVILPRKLSMYERYIAEQSLPGDAIILMNTAWAVLAPRTKA
jgi:lipopolysaccharide/colanic/teichoic acid biosynthesis glycosyltransferase